MLRDIYEKSKNIPLAGPFINFITTEVWNRDVKRGGNNPLSPDWQKQRLLLMHAKDCLNTRDACNDVEIPLVKDDEMKVYLLVLPGDEKDNRFLTFPFNKCGYQINSTTTELSIFDNPFFKFHIDGFQLHEKTGHPFESSSLSYSTYRTLKTDVVEKNTPTG